MSIPIKDISAGDTVSAMVDKINYNFDLLSLKGGGPAGIQGIQGIRGSIGEHGEQGIGGERGSRIYNFNPDEHPAANYNTGDMTLYGGVFYIVLNNGSENYWEPAMNINEYAESPFTNTEYRTIVPRANYIDDQIVFGLGNTDTENADLQTRRLDSRSGSALVISGKNFEENDIKYHISLYGKNAMPTSYSTDYADGNLYIDYDESMPGASILKLEGRGTDDAVRVGCGNEYVQIHNGTITLSTRNSMPVATGGTAIVTTDEAGNVTNEYKWRIGTANHELYPTEPLDIGSQNCRIGDIYVKQGAVVNFIDSNYGVNDFLRFNVQTSQTNFPVFALSSRGVSFGIQSANAAEHFINNYNSSNLTHFGIYVGNENTKNAPHITLVTKSTIQSQTLSERLTIDDSATLYTLTPNASAYARLMAISIDKYIDIKAKNNSTVHTKAIGNTLCISGADYSSKTYGSGKDIVITGGRADNSVNTMESVGGTVFITGGASVESVGLMDIESVGLMDIETSADTYIADIRRMGNVIIGINPIYHTDIQRTDVYSADKEYDNLTSTNPSGVEFFDTNNVAVHANRIVIDSNANYRKGTYGNFTNNQPKENYPYIEDPDKSTLQFSGINTLKHTTPVLLNAAQCCEHQFLSGVMKQAFKLQWVNGNIVVAQTSLSDNENYDHSLVFVVDQVWQKVGNVVNVNLRAEWFAYNENGSFYNVTDYMFGFNVRKQYFLASVLQNPQFKLWYSAAADPDFASYSRLTSKNMCLTKFYNGLSQNSSIPIPLSSADFYNNKSYYDYIYKSIEELDTQPISVFQIPVSITGKHISHIYGNGNIMTEGINGWYIYDQNNDSYLLQEEIGYETPVLKSTSIIVGERTNERKRTDWGMFGSPLPLTSQQSTKLGINSTTHSEYGLWGNLSELKDSNSKSNLYSDNRMSMQSVNFMWNEHRFIKTTKSDNDNEITYIYPQMIVPFGNVSRYVNQQVPNYNNIITPNDALRPVVGLYTSMSLNYSYVITPNLSDQFDGMSYKGIIMEPTAQTDQNNQEFDNNQAIGR